jgi:hypothetical protein
MAAFSDYLENALVSHILRNTAYTTPGTSIYVALFTGSPGDDNSGTANEVSGNNYSRVQYTNWAAPSNGATSNSANIDFPEASGSWGTITHIGIYDASTSGNLLFHGAASTSVAIAANQIYRIKSGTFTITLA